MELRQLRYFLAVAEHLNFSKAAEHLHVVQPALSRQIKHLEEEIGAKLLERNSKHVRLTPAGQIFRKRVAMTLEQTTAAANIARKTHQGEEGRLRIGFVRTASWGVLPKLLAIFYKECPAVAIELEELSSSTQLVALREDKIDFGLTNEFSNDGRLEFRVLSNRPFIVALPSHHPYAKHPVIDLKWLSEDRFLFPPRRPHGIQEQALEACLDAGFMPKYELVVKGAEIALCLVSAGVGVALVPYCLQKMHLDGVVYRPLKSPFGRVDCIAVRRKGEKLSLVERLWNLLDTAGIL